MEGSDDKPKISKAQIIGSALVMITGLFVMLAMANTITGRITSTHGPVSISEISIGFWGFLILAVGIWIIRRKDFSKSILDN